MINWRRGQVVVSRQRTAREGPLTEFLDSLPDRDPPLVRVPGVAVFLNPSKDTTPLALRAEVEYTNTFHERAVIVSIDQVSIPHVDDHERFTVERLGRKFKACHVTARVGYHDEPDVPELLRLCRKDGLLERNLDLEHASYFLSRATLQALPTPGLSRWRKLLFITMAHNAANPAEYFGLPADRTVVMGNHVSF